MAKSVIIKLTTAGTNVGPFNMLSNADSYVTPFETNISRATLVTGYTSSLVPDAATIIRALSSGSCTNYVDLTITSSIPPTTTTSTTTTTTTAAPTTTTSTTTTTTTAAPTTTSTTTTTTTAAPTTTTSTTTTTTTLAITFNLAIIACMGVSASVTASNFANSISGLYEINTVTYGTLNDSLFGTFEDTVGSSKTYMLVPQGVRYVSVRDKNNVTNISYNTINNNCTTSTTTTTTTLSPIVITNSAVTCSGNLGEFTSTFTGGTGTYTTASIGNSPAAVAVCIGGGVCAPGSRVNLSPGATSYTWTNIVSGSWYVAVKDNLPQTSVNSTAVNNNCTTTTSTTTTTTTAAPTTTTSTTTTTTTDPYDYYIADEIDCSNCSVIAADQRVAFPIGASVTLNRYYRYVGEVNDFIYYVKEVTTTGGAVALELPAYTNCNAACGNTTTTTSTTTTTTTAAPTTTTSTTTTTTTIGYELYTADRYDCTGPMNTCEFVETIQIGNPSVLVEGKFYYDFTNSYIFNIVGAPGAGPYLITSMSGLGTNNCSSLCSV